MEYLQGKEAVDSGASPVYGSMQVAGMVGQSVSKMGGLFQSLGEQGTEIAVQAAKADIRRKSNVMQLELSQKKAEYEANMLRNPNPAMVARVGERGSKSSQSICPTGRERGGEGCDGGII